jgi:hypothetical protein
MPRNTLTILRKLLVGLFAFGLAGLGVELVMLEHYEEAWMVVPLAAIALSLVSALAHLSLDSARSAWTLRILAATLMALGGIGMSLHFRGSMEFQLDMDPTMSRSALFWKVLHMKAPPTLAPGALIQFGLLGLVSTYRHPALGRGDSSPLGDPS